MHKQIKSDIRFRQYAIAAAAFLAAGSSEAAVIYTDVDPDNVISGEGAEMQVDINADGSDDFTFMIYSFTGSVSYSGTPFFYGVKVGVVIALGDNQLMGSPATFSGYTINYLPQLPEGSDIASTDEFVNGYGTLALSVTLFGFPYITYGNWVGADMAYMGFRLANGDNYNYGWMRLSVSESGDMITLHDYAYQTNVDQSITAGQTVAIDDTNPLSAISVYSFGSTVYVSGGELIPEISLRLLNIDGQVVKEVNAISNNNSVDCSNLPTGQYTAQISDGTNTSAKEIFINN